MKGNFNNIEDLFKQKFEGFEPDVDPGLWTNIQAGISNAGVGSVASTGLSTGLKIGLISTGVVAASVATWYLAFNEPQNNIQQAEPETVRVSDPIQAQNTESIIVVEDTNDPVIRENRENIEQELRNYQVSQSDLTNTSTGLTNGTLSNGSTTQSEVQSNPTNPVNQLNNQPNNSAGTVNVPETEKAKSPSGRLEYSITAGVPANAEFNSNALNEKEVRWDFGDGTFGEGKLVKHNYTKPGVYSVTMTVVGNGGSAYQETVEVTVNTKASIDNVPNVITPNGDRINDYFYVKSTDIETFTISIRDRNGNEVFSSNDKDFSWDGTNYSGDLVEKGMYTYLIIAEGKDGSVIKLPGQIYVQ